MKTRSLIPLFVALSGATTAFSQSADLRLEMGSTTREPLIERTNEVYRDFINRLNKSSLRYRQTQIRVNPKTANQPYIMPAIVRLTQNGVPIPTGGRTRSNELTLDIDASFNTTADPGRVAFMQSVYNNSKSLIESLFGDAAIAGTVRVVNYDAQIGDRNAVTGGFYVPNNGAGVREIRLPLNASREFAAVSLIHCLLLAYLPDQLFGFDIYLEGLVRATTARIVRIPAAMPGLDQDLIGTILENTYEIGGYYDWTNQKSLGASRFIAPNLITTPIADGTLGGIFLPRYKMACSMWQKVIAEYPSFISAFLLAYRGNTSISNSPSGLRALVVSTLNGITPSATIEGIPASSWLDRQYIFSTRNVPGTKLHALIAPITSGLSGTDFGVFTIETTWFSSDSSGNEVLLSGTSFPIFWDRDFNRIIPSAQSERIDIAGSYGSVVPNFANDNANLPYRVTLDLPIQDRNVRKYLPAGAIATPTQTTPNDFFGTVVGFLPPANGLLKVRLTVGSTTFPDINVQNQAFGGLLNSPLFTGTAATTVQLISQDASANQTVLLTRRVNKGPGPLAVELGNSQIVNSALPGSLSSGVQLMGIPGEPLASSLDDAFGTTNFLAARFNPGLARYDLFPTFGAVGEGFGYFVRVPATASPVVASRVEANIAVAVSLRPGWNLITCPISESVPFTQVDVVRASEFPRTYAGATGQDPGDTGTVLLGRSAFRFLPGANDPNSGVPEGGTFVEATNFAPGVGYFVRCLVPEGAVMLFRPSQSRSRSVNSPMSGIQAPFQLKLDVVGNGSASFTLLGLSPTATDGFDPIWDSNLPPSIGGLQISTAVGNEQRYLDVKKSSSQKSFRVVVNGLVKGSNYILNLSTLRGSSRVISVQDISNKRLHRFMRPSGRLGFVATGSSMFFDLTVEGAR